MSTTNPDSGRPPVDPVGGLTHAAPGTPRADDHDISGPPAPETIARGHEEDRYDAVSVLSVPLLVIVFFVMAFVTVSVIFYYIAPTVDDPDVHPQAVERNKAPLNERLERYGRGKEIDQPRLEPLKLRSGDARAITRPELPTGNSPELHPEDLRPSPTNTPSLFRSGWVDPNKTIARLTIDDALDVAIKANLLPTSKTPSAPHGSANQPTAANAGRGFGPSKAEPPKAPPAGEAKKDEIKKDDGKQKEEGKK